MNEKIPFSVTVGQTIDPSMIARTFSLFVLVSTAAVAAREAVPVRVIAPAPAEESASYDLPGRTEPIEQARIFSRATGMVKERLVDIGDRVKEGDALAVIEIPELEERLESARASVDQASARADIARSTARRSQGLLEARAVSKEEAEQREASAAELEAAVRVAKAEVARLEVLKEFAVVRAPFQATIAARRIDRGDFVRGESSATGEWAFHLVRLNELRFAVSATPDVALRLNEGSEASVRFPELPGRRFPAKVSRSSNFFETASGTMRVELLLENEDFTLPAGLTGTASFTLAPAAGTFLLPNNTLVLNEGKSMVAVVEDGKMKLVEVLPGRNLGPRVEVTSTGLNAESQVIVSPNALLRPGDPVNATPLGEGG